MTGAEHPEAGLPFRAVLTVSTLYRQHEACRATKATLEDTAKPLTFFRFIEFVVERINIDWKLPLFQGVCERIFVRADEVIGIDRQYTRKFQGESMSLGFTKSIIPITSSARTKIRSHTP